MWRTAQVSAEWPASGSSHTGGYLTLTFSGFFWSGGMKKTVFIVVLLPTTPASSRSCPAVSSQRPLPVNKSPSSSSGPHQLVWWEECWPKPAKASHHLPCSEVTSRGQASDFPGPLSRENQSPGVSSAFRTAVVRLVKSELPTRGR